VGTTQILLPCFFHQYSGRAIILPRDTRVAKSGRLYGAGLHLVAALLALAGATFVFGPAQAEGSAAADLKLTKVLSAPSPHLLGPGGDREVEYIASAAPGDLSAVSAPALFLSSSKSPAPASAPASAPAPEPVASSDPLSVPASSPPPVLADASAPAASATAASAPAASDPGVPTTQAVPNAVPPWQGRRGLPQALDNVFPYQEWVGSAHQLPIGVNDSNPVFPLEKLIYKACPILQKERIRIYGWVDPGYNASTSKRSNIPLSYAIVPNRLELDQLVLRFERVPDTVQTEKCDWGFRFSNVFGIDYRYTTAQGWYPATRQLLSRNMLYGYDPVECYGVFYVPKVAQGMVLKLGRYISPPDIEAQLSPDNYLYSHSLMFTYDCYTQTGLLSTIKLNDQWQVSAGIHAGNDIAPWNRAAIPTAQGFLRYTTKSNNDSFFGGVDAINNGHYRLNQTHDNLQQFNLTWSHRFTRRLNMATEGYYIYQYNALKGGTANYGPVRAFGGGGGPGMYLPGLSNSFGFVNYINYKLTDKDYITLRPIDYLGDTRGERTGFATTYASWTLGMCHRFTPLLCIRPEVRYERALNGHQNPYDNGTRRYQFTFAMDVIKRF
jgi:hypothetical protein